MLSTPEIKLGNYVVIKHDPDKLQRMVIKISYILGGSVLFGLASGSDYSEHSFEEIEIPNEDEE